MATEIRVPTLGESVTEATIGKWFKSVGEAVNQDEALVELETDKVTVEVPASAAGKLVEINAQEGDTIEVGALLGLLEEGAAGDASTPVKQASSDDNQLAKASVSEQSQSNAAPSAQKMMKENNISLEQGSGKRGQVLKEDVMKAIHSPQPSQQAAQQQAPRTASPQDDASREERVKMTKLRQTIARRLKDAQNTAAMLTTFNEVDLTNVMAIRKKYKDLFEKKHGIKLGFMSFFVKAACHALQELPAVNAEIDGNDIIYKNYYHIGVAVGTDKGLVVPVIRDADQLSLAGIEGAIADYGRKARDGNLSIGDMQGGTFTISNGGVYGSLMSTPILNAPQSAILGMHKIQERPMVINGEIKIRPMMYLAVSYDHRIIDGKEAVTFLVRIKENLEDPERLLLDL